jgi:hypothetical protein
MTIAGLYQFECRVSSEAVMRQFEIMVERFPRFADKMMLNRRGMPTEWRRDDQFLMARHVTEVGGHTWSCAAGER